MHFESRCSFLGRHLLPSDLEHLERLPKIRWTLWNGGSKSTREENKADREKKNKIWTIPRSSVIMKCSEWRTRSQNCDWRCFLETIESHYTSIYFHYYSPFLSPCVMYVLQMPEPSDTSYKLIVQRCEKHPSYSSDAGWCFPYPFSLSLARFLSTLFLVKSSYSFIATGQKSLSYRPFGSGGLVRMSLLCTQKWQRKLWPP